MKGTGGSQHRVSAPGVTETAGTALCGRQFRNFAPSGSHVGLKNKLGHALAVLNTSLVTRGVQKEHQNFTGIVRVDDANALSNGNAVARAKAAARVNKTCNASRAGLHTYARAYLEPVPGWTAVPTLLCGRIPSYRITACPEFVSDGTEYDE